MKLVDAVNVSEIESVSRILLKDNKQNRLYADIWKVGINFALRIGDLLNIKFDDLDLINHEISLVEQKTTKPRLIKINVAALAIIQERRALYPNDIYLFSIRKVKTFAFQANRFISYRCRKWKSLMSRMICEC